MKISRGSLKFQEVVVLFLAVVVASSHYHHYCSAQEQLAPSYSYGGVSDKPCTEGYGGRCYCSSSTSNVNQNCDVTQDITHTGPAYNSSLACQTFCKDECGATAGSFFICYADDQPMEHARCEKASNGCKCICDDNTDPITTKEAPSDMFMHYPEQCNAYCDQEDVCSSNNTNGIMGTSCTILKSSSSSTTTTTINVLTVAIATMMTIIAQVSVRTRIFVNVKCSFL